ncbi:MAG: NUDIX domain-containing protein [Polaribacter sp.]|nr:NUDIX domain-containing protein [Polaribacter sp.]
MYKVFVNDAPIIVTDSLNNKNRYPVFAFKDLVLEELLCQFENNIIKGAVLFCDDLEKDWTVFKNSFNVIVAGGGLVLNANKEILFIYRNGIWDLPKGRLEEGETIESTALREVEEECGIKNLFLKKFLIVTYHVFYYKKEKRLKETFWYVMDSNYSEALTPQLEEGITKAVFKNETESKHALRDTYENIKLVIETYQKTLK